MNIIKKISKIFENSLNYETVNNFSDKKLRNSKISLSDFILFRLLYAKPETTHEEITSILNTINKSNFSRQAYTEKEKNIPVEFYENLLHQIMNLSNDLSSPDEEGIEEEYDLVGVDGVYNASLDRTPMLNLGIFNITQNVPIAINYEGNGNRNKEIKVLMEYIRENLDEFKKYILVADRGYHSYEFIKFLIDNNIKFIIRIKKNGDNLNPRKKLSKGTKNYRTIKEIRKYVRVVKSKKSFKKSVNISKSKKEKNIVDFKQESDCTLVTNLKDSTKHPKNLIIKYYSLRWDIEVFFKHIKYNFKFRNLDEKEEIQHKKIYICDLIIMYITKIIENDYVNGHPQIFNKDDGYIRKINKSNLIKGIFNGLITDLVRGKITKKSYETINKYIKININLPNRSFPRTSKTPFTRWYVKDYSERTKYSRIINAIFDKKVDSLHPNLKSLAKRIKMLIK